MKIKVLKVDSENKLVIENGDFVWLEDDDAVTQLLGQRLRTFKNEWLYDTDLGVDYFGVVFPKGSTDREIYAEIRKVTEEVPGITGVLSMSLDHDTATRTLTVTLSASSDYGTINFNEVI